MADEDKNQETTVQADVETMNKSFDDIIVGDPEPEPEPEPVVDPPIEDPPLEELPVEDPPIEDLPPEDDPPTDPPSSGDDPPGPKPDVIEPEPIDDKDKIIEDLRTKLAEKVVEPTPTPEPEPVPDPEPQPPAALEDQDFLGDTDPEDLVRDPAEFNKMLNKVFHQGIDNARKVLGEGVLRAIPDIVKANVVSMANLQKASEEFYKENEDLEPFKRVVGVVFEEIASDNPGKSYSELLPKVGDEVRNRLELHKKAVIKDKDNPKPVRLPRNKGRSKSLEIQPDTDPLMSELDQMNESLESN